MCRQSSTIVDYLGELNTGNCSENDGNVASFSLAGGEIGATGAPVCAA
jgi:hypothetical protein